MPKYVHIIKSNKIVSLNKLAQYFQLSFIPD